MKVEITRTFWNEKQTIGQLNVIEDNRVLYSCCTLELPWLDNQKGVSCIPTGIYTVRKRVSPKFGESFIFEDVPDRSYILIHPGNFHTQIQGCVLVGQRLKHINSDGVIDVAESKKAVQSLLELLPDSFTCVID